MKSELPTAPDNFPELHLLCKPARLGSYQRGKKRSCAGDRRNSTSTMSTRDLRPASKTGAADLEWAISINRKILKLLGLWTYSNESKWQTARSNILTCFFTFGILNFIVFPQTLALIRVWGDLTLIVDNLIINLPAATSVLKIIVPWWEKKALASIFNEIEQDWLSKKTPTERETMVRYAALGRTMTIVGIFGGFFSFAFYHGPLVFGIAPRTITNLTDYADYHTLSIQALYPYEVSTLLRYCLTEVSELLGCVLAFVAYTGIDVFFGVVVLHACGQFENLTKRIEVMAGKADFSELLRLHVQNHYRLIRFVETIEEACSLMLLALFASVALTFCVLGFQLIEACTNKNNNIPISQVAFYMQFLSYCLFLIFVYSWVGENLVTQSRSIFTAVCNCDWTPLTPRETVQMTLILMQSQRPLEITAGKVAPVTLSTFASLLKTSAGYISCLLAVRN